ncbi:MAG: 3'(2'),5'-bisphosphate nucleotidase CysQ [Holosporales bacterium]|jgi:3'(2'), 5'-bisphosphate nucleotidase|nr:3'(2'),5'-bisphosphate nucleotidase CysQ [Holosporales bacterium]
MKQALIDIIQEAGKIVASYWGNATHTQKDDLSPLTEADKASHVYLSKALSELTPFPIVSEEEEPEYDKRKTYTQYWLIDPLDGTKEFINGHRDFCVNIALIQNKAPIIGMIFAPLLNELYYAKKGEGFSYTGPEDFKTIPQAQSRRTVISRFHHSQATQHFLSINALTETITIGAALKFGYLAAGRADIYPRFEGSKEWDIAAGHLILEESGGAIIDLKTHYSPIYNKLSMKNNAFIACRKGIDFKSLTFPENICVG